MAESQMPLQEATALVEEVIDEVETVVIADRDFLENVMLGVVTRGHILLEDVPGTGKTLTANAFARVLNLSFSRIQFTPDLLPKDVLGTNVFNETDGTFEFQEGPIFGNVILGDEINRAPPKTQAAMLETMAEQQVTVEGETRDLPDPFLVIATQNPVEQEGTFPLPEAQVDRFLVKDTLGQPDREGKVELLRRRADRFQSIPEAEPMIDDPERILALQRVPERIRVHEDLLGYIAEIVERTHEDHRSQVGVSPRGLQRLFEASRARAVIEGREYVTPGDIQRIANPVLSHRVVLSPQAEVNNVRKQQVVQDIIDDVSVPTIEDADGGGETEAVSGVAQ
jgi:MoxR-like ATPase